jgi:RNA polymerase sigma-70 factor (ECF subfamily)
MSMPELSKTREPGAYPHPVALAAFSGAPGIHRSPRVDDTHLVRQAQQGDTIAFEQLVQNYDRTVLRLALNITRSMEDAQDIYQEAFLRAYRNIGRFRFECSFYTWIYRIVTNLCLDHLRKSNSRGRDVTTELSPEGEEESVVDRMPDDRAVSSPERSFFSRELRERIVRALKKLSPRERLVFELKHYHGLKLQTVANILNTTENTIKNTLFRATRKLRLDLAELR